MTQCFETFPQYGDDPVILNTKINAFWVGLDDYDLPEIDYAFRHWLKENSKMPMPSEIGFIARGHRRSLREAARPKHRKSPNVVTRNCVPWGGLTWKEINEQGFIPQIEAHLVELTKLRGKERAEGYLNYLKTYGANQKAMVAQCKRNLGGAA